jgi:adenine-specific DNA-methyltransferase
MDLDPPHNYGPDNPHPLSTRKTELIWEGKYDEYGNRREVDVAGMAMPMQRIETIDEPASRLKSQGELFNPQKSHRDDFRNMLIWGDNKLVMASLLKDFKGRIDLIYIDPPFDVGADFTMNIPIGDGDEVLDKDQSTLEMVAYRDMWGKGTDSYLHMMYERLMLMRDLLSEKGSICVHCDWRIVGKLKCLLEEVFGIDNLGSPNNGRCPWYTSTQGARDFVMVCQDAGFSHKHCRKRNTSSLQRVYTEHYAERCEREVVLHQKENEPKGYSRRN